MPIKIIQGDNLEVMRDMPAKRYSLIYADLPFNTGNTQSHKGSSYEDSFKDYLRWLRPRLKQAIRLLKKDGSLFIHLDYREVHYVKVMLDKLLGRHNFRNEIIWSYDYGARSKKRWSTKHDTILWYTISDRYTFDLDASDRIPYMAPGLCGADKAARGKTPTDVWWHTIVPTQGKERVGYPTQKPLGILRRIVAVHSRRGERCLDFCAGSGSFAAACSELDRRCTAIDNNPQAVKIMKKRFKRAQ